MCHGNMVFVICTIRTMPCDGVRLGTGFSLALFLHSNINEIGSIGLTVSSSRCCCCWLSKAFTCGLIKCLVSSGNEVLCHSNKTRITIRPFLFSFNDFWRWSEDEFLIKMMQISVHIGIKLLRASRGGYIIQLPRLFEGCNALLKIFGQHSRTVVNSTWCREDKP